VADKDGVGSPIVTMSPARSYPGHSLFIVAESKVGLLHKLGDAPPLGWRHVALMAVALGLLGDVVERR